MKIHVLEMPDPVGDAIRAEALMYRKCMQGQYESVAYKARRELAKMTERERIQAELVMLKNLTEDCPRATELVQRHGLPFERKLERRRKALRKVIDSGKQ